MKKRIFCLLLVIAVMASLGMTAFAEADVVDPPSQDPASTEVNTPPAEPEPAADAPAPETTESAPSAEPAQDQVSEPSVQDQAPAADGLPAGNEILGDEPSAGEPSTIDVLEPTDVPAPTELTLTLRADKDFISVQDACAGWNAIQANKDTWREVCPNGFITLTLEGAPEGAAIEWSVKPNEGGASAVPDGTTATTCVSLAEGSTLYLTGGSDISGCPNGHVYNIAVSATVDGTTSNIVNVTFVCQREDEQTTPPVKPEDTADNAAYGVWLHVINGSFTGTFGNPDEEAKDISSAGSVWVEFQPETVDEATGAVTSYSRRLPEKLPTAEATNGKFIGWYTGAPIEKLEDSDDGSFCYRTSVQNNLWIQPGVTEVPEGVQVLYATFEYKVPEEGDTQLIQYYFDYNGMNGMYGNCITSTGVKGSSQFTPETAAIYNFNFTDNPNAPDHYVGKPTWDGLKAYWENTTFNGYKFLGWSVNDPTGEIITVDTPIHNHDVFYAHWTAADGTNSDSYVRPEETVKPLTDIRIISGFNVDTHAAAGSTLTVSIYCSPLGAVAENVTYTLVFSPNSDGDIRNIFKKPETRTVTAGAPFNVDNADGFGFKAEVVGTSLVVTNLDGQSHGIRVSVTAESIEGTPVAAIEPATLSFEHQVNGGWVTTEPATCTGYGQQEATCTGCGKTVIRKIYPLNHDFSSGYVKRFQDPTCTVPGLEGRVCARCEAPYSQYLAEMGLVGGYKDTEVPANGHDLEVTSTFTDHDGMRCFNGECKVCKAEASGEYGDINSDGDVTLIDAAKLYQYVSGKLTQLPLLEAGDVNGSGNVSLVDAARLYQYVSGKIPVI